MSYYNKQANTNSNSRKLLAYILRNRPNDTTYQDLFAYFNGTMSKLQIRSYTSFLKRIRLISKKRINNITIMNIIPSSLNYVIKLVNEM
jgi:hypothetical protein